MTTEEGVIRAKTAWRYIETLRRRLEYLEQLKEPWNSWDLAEIASIEWALSVLETEARWLTKRPIYSTDARRDDVAIIERCPACGALPKGKQKKEPSLLGYGGRNTDWENDALSAPVQEVLQ